MEAINHMYHKLIILNNITIIVKYMTTVLDNRMITHYDSRMIILLRMMIKYMTIHHDNKMTTVIIINNRIKVELK